MPPALTKKTEMDIVRMISEEVSPKEIAFQLNISVDPVYHIRAKYFKEKWVLRRHPKDDFTLES
jgi:DNA-binding CsgD family transcriptional regulator